MSLHWNFFYRLARLGLLELAHPSSCIDIAEF